MLQAIPQRLDKHLRDATRLRRREVAAALHAGRVEVASPTCPRRVVTRPHTLIFNDDAVWLDGARAHRPTTAFHAALHKPAGVLTAARDPHGRPCLAPWLAALTPGVVPVGRLDRATTGLLVLTDDGDLVQALTHPSHHVTKTYRLHLAAALDPADPRLAALRAGVTLDTGPARALRVTLETSRAHASEVVVVVDEGRYHLVRKMCGRVRLPLTHLHREAVGPLTLADLAPGAVRPLRDDEAAALWTAAGSARQVRQAKIDALRRQAHRLRARRAPDLRLERWLDAFAPQEP